MTRHRGSGNDTESLEAEASWRRREVEEAVLDAEAEEREELAERQRRGATGGEPHVPSVIRPGNYGGDDDGDSR